ncbi:hypothetical protein BVRB_1g002450 [Beta vulgaris subsp. vulgaris]|nr:hypothetical protein BVRB_1g002450 [Beta vulgaris subsp. vulgaris]
MVLSVTSAIETSRYRKVWSCLLGKREEWYSIFKFCSSPLQELFY